MIIYTGYFLLTVFYGLILKEYRGKTNSLIYFLFLFLIFALRHPSMGIDLNFGSDSGYLGAYEFFAKCPWDKLFLRAVYRYEYGYIVFNKLLSYISANPQMLLVGTSFICFVLIFHTIDKESDDPLFSTLIYLGLSSFLMVFSALRQAIAISFIFAAVPLIKKKRFLLFLFFVGLATSFHKTALIFLFAYPLFHLRFSFQLRIILSFVLLIVLYGFSSRIYPLFNRFVVYKMDYNGSNTLFLIYVLVYFFCCVMGGEKVSGYLNLFFVACCILCFEHLSNVISRLAMYYEMILVLLLPAVFSCCSQKYHLLKYFVALCFVFSALYFIKNTYWSMSYPYYFLWEQVRI